MSFSSPIQTLSWIFHPELSIYRTNYTSCASGLKKKRAMVLLGYANIFRHFLVSNALVNTLYYSSGPFGLLKFASAWSSPLFTSFSWVVLWLINNLLLLPILFKRFGFLNLNGWLAAGSLATSIRSVRQTLGMGQATCLWSWVPIWGSIWYPCTSSTLTSFTPLKIITIMQPTPSCRQ